MQYAEIKRNGVVHAFPKKSLLQSYLAFPK